ncbi:MAG: DNA-3-methyladenine glycosylase I [Hyphomicrobiaceae bacterium]
MAKPDVTRCGWAGDDPLYMRYHDEEWGVPKTGDVGLFEKLILEGFQAGLSWITILRKRDHFRKVFDDFAPERIVRYDDAKIAELMADPGIVRNRAKIEATISNAKAYLALSDRQSFASFIWDFVDGTPIQNRVASMASIPTETEISKAMSKALKKEGFRFVGPTTLYAFMQSVGMVNDHLLSCHRHAACTKLAKSIKPPKR